MELVAHHQIYYSNKNEIPIRDVAASLIALEELIKRSPRVLEELFPDIQIQKVEVYLDELKAGSLWEDIVVKLVFGGQDRMDIAIDNLREKLGMDNVVNGSNVLSTILVSMVLIGGYALIDGKEEPQKTQHIENSIINVINLGAETLGMESEDLRAVIEKVMDKSMAVAATKVVKPARSDPEASIEFNIAGREAPPVTIGPDTVRALPVSVNLDDEREDVKDFDRLEVRLVATDQESIKKGWAVRLPEFDDRRVRLHIDPHIDPDELYGKRVFHANATVMLRPKDGEMQPYLVFLREILED